MDVKQVIPIYDSYWVIPGRLMAGEYPCSPHESEARAKARWLLSQEVTYCVDLTEPGESGLRPYDGLLIEEAALLGKKVIHDRLSIKDMHTPEPGRMKRILDTMDSALEAGHTVYVHCYGGIGRTGTVVGCYLARHGQGGQAALHQIAEWRRNTPDGWRESPETDEQRQLVLEWKTGD